MDNNILIEVVAEFNFRLYDLLVDDSGCSPNYPDHMPKFSFIGRGTYECVTFDEVVLWDSENHPNDVNIKEYLKDEFKKYINILNKIEL